MARSRTPIEKAKTAGADVKNPSRFKGRKAPKGKRPVGDPPASMTDAQKAAWEEFRKELPWLNSSHRVILRAACDLTARMENGELGVSAIHALSSILSKLGATPADASKVMSGHDEDDEDPADEFFTVQ